MIAIYTSFGKQVKIKLIEKNMTEKELAELIGVGQPYLTCVLKGRKPGYKYISTIEQILDMNTENRIGE